MCNLNSPVNREITRGRAEQEIQVELSGQILQSLRDTFAFFCIEAGIRLARVILECFSISRLIRDAKLRDVFTS